MSELSRETEELLERGRGGTPLTPAHRARLRGAILAKATGVAVVATATSASAWTSLGAKIVGAALLVATVGGAGAAIGMRISVPTPAPSAMLANPVATDQGTPPASKSSTQAPGAISNVTGLRTATSVTAPTFTPVPAPHTTSASIPTPALITVPAPTRRETLAPVAAATVSSPVPTPVPLPAFPPTPTLPPTTLAKAVRLLGDADLAVKGGDPERALALLDEHAAAFPRSDLEPERSAERVFALCRAGRIDEARHAASAFLGAHPPGPLAQRVKGACRGAPRE